MAFQEKQTISDARSFPIPFPLAASIWAAATEKRGQNKPLGLQKSTPAYGRLLLT